MAPLDLGHFLKSCRQQSGYALEDLALLLGVSVEQLKSLEHNSYDQFEDEATLKACLHAYADRVDLNPGAIERLYQRQLQQQLTGSMLLAQKHDLAKADAPEALESPAHPLPKRQIRTRFLPWKTLLALLLFGGGVLGFWQPIIDLWQQQTQPAASEEKRQFKVIPLRGGMVSVHAKGETRFRLSVDNKDRRLYHFDAQGVRQWRVRTSAEFILEDPDRVTIVVNKVPLSHEDATQILLLPE